MQKQTYVILGAVLVIVFVLAGAVLVRQKQKEPAPVMPTPVSQPPVITPTPPVVAPPTNQTPQTIQTPKGWKTYENQEFGFAFDYPGDWGVGDGLKYQTSYGYQFILQIEWPRLDFPIGAEQGLNVEQTKERIKNLFNNDEKVNIDERKITVSNNKGIELTIRWKKNNVSGTHKYIVFQHPYRADISFNIGLYEPVDPLQRQVVDSFRFLP